MPDVMRRKGRTTRLDTPLNLGLPRGTRIKSHTYVWGLPLYEVAIGPESKLKQKRGHARAIIAIGDVATGVIAIGGYARGLLAIGGLAIGCISIGGCGLGLVIGIGGLAAGAVALGGLAAGAIAIGGAAIGYIALGGGALGYYACGGATYGRYVIDSIRQHPEAIEFFRDWVPGLQPVLDSLRPHRGE